MTTRARLFAIAVCALAQSCMLPGFDDDSSGRINVDEPEQKCLPPQIIPLDLTLPRLAVTRSDAKLRPAQSCDDVARWTIKQHAEQWLPAHHRSEPYYCYIPSRDDNNNFNNSGWGSMDMSGPQDMSAPPVEPDPDQPIGPDDYSMTNVQERGVDEPDSIKTDGRYIYAVHDVGVKVFKSWPVEQAAEIATINITANGTLSMMLIGDRLILIISGERSELMIYDVSSPATPTLTQRIKLPGAATHVRRIKGRIHFVMQSQWFYDDSINGALEQRALPVSLHSPSYEMETRIEQSRHNIYEDIDALIPFAAVRRRLPIASLELPNRPAVELPLYDDCAGNILLNDALPVNPQLVSLVSMDIADLSDIKTTGAIMDPDLFYTSSNNMYITSS